MSEDIEKDKIANEASDVSDMFDNSTWMSSKTKQGRKKDEEEYARRFLGI